MLQMPSGRSGSQVYYDADKGQYYTIATGPQPGGYDPSLMAMAGPFKLGYKNYLGQSLLGNNNQSMVSQMLANRQPYQYNAPTAQQMFPGMGSPLQGMFPGQGRPFMGTMPTQAQGSPMLGGSFGAGRFLGGNQAGLLGTSVSGT